MTSKARALATPVALAAQGHDHAVELGAPFFAPGGGMSLHRYQDSEFVPRFLNDLAAGRLGDPAGADWWRTDRFSEHDDHLVLRLPVHRTFYLVACELSCPRLGRPAVDPARVTSTGFVIRRIGGPAERAGSRREAGRRARAARALTLKERLFGRDGTAAARALEARETSALDAALAQAPGELAWVLEEGEPLGWRPAVPGGRDPDLGRRPCLNGVLRREPAPPVYSGEETHPLHLVSARDAGGRLHSILYGYLPLGGQFLPPPAPFDAAAESEALDAERERLPWPFGWQGRADRVWRAEDGDLVQSGRPSAACFALLEVLVNRYHLGEAARTGVDPLNAGLAEAAGSLRFVDESAPFTRSGPADGDFFGAPAVFGGLALRSPFSLWDWLEACFAAGEDNPLPAWLAAERQRIDAAGGLASAGSIAALPGRPADGGTLALGLYIEEADAEEWRLLLGERLLAQARRTGAEVPVPKFLQAPEDLYRVLPFVRVRDDAGRERCYWGPAAAMSPPFRVAAPFDPDASRPVTIQMPGLGDLKRGLARGAAMLIPPDTQALLESLKLSEGASPSVVGAPPPGGPALGVQWICSFSLPVITLVAMILLMIMVIILNLVFFWLPWVRICLPFPKARSAP